MNINKNRHYISLFILSLNYIFPILIFGKITLFYVDALDSEIVYNYILGKFYSGDLEAAQFFLGGSIKIEYLRRLLQPFSLLYSIFNSEIAYWIIDITVKITSYLSFYLLAKKINRNLFFCAIAASVYASINLPTHEGFYFSIFPYLVYLIFFKKNISLKHYSIILFFGLNSDILRSPYFIPVILILLLLFKNLHRNFLKNFIKISLVFLSAILISNINIIYSVLFDGPFHRHEWVKDPMPLNFLLKNTFFGMIDINLNSTKYHLALGFPNAIFQSTILVLSFFLIKKKLIYKTLIIIFLISLFSSLIRIDIFLEFLNNFNLKIFNYTYLKDYLIFFYLLLFLFIFNDGFKFKNYFILLVFFSLLLMQVNSSIGPIYKKYLKKEDSFRNFYTFEGYYLPDEYKKIKKIVKDKRVMSIGLDPMVAIINDIKTIDGYHNLYPLHYKKKFKKVIEAELKEDIFWKNYFNNYGSRLYAIVKNTKNIKINFTEAKRLGAEYVISKYSLDNQSLIPICENCGIKDFFIYKIN